MNKQQLASTIWESANQMRSKIEANEYKDFILGFIFYKYLSESEVRFFKKEGMSDEDITKMDESDQGYVDYVKEQIGYFISYENLFSTWLAKKNDFDVSDVRKALSAFDRLISPTHKKVFEKIFNTLQTGLSKLGESATAQTKAIKSLIQLINKIPMDGKQDYDVLGFIYEYLISMFAANAGKKAGEFYTPHEVSVLMSEIIAEHLKDRKEIRIYDPTSGSGSLLINIGAAVSKHVKGTNKINYYAQELKENTYNLTRMNLVMRGIEPANIFVRNGDTLEDDWPFFEDNDLESYQLVKVDAVVSNPPYSQKWDVKDKKFDPRFSGYGVAPKGKADFAFLLHDLYHLEDNGIMTIVLPHGVLFRGNEEHDIRMNLIEKNNIDAIIGLPANIFFGTSIQTIVMVLKRKRKETDVLIIDASKGFEKAGKNNVLRASDIRRIADTVRDRAPIPGYSAVVSKEKIRENDYNLNIPRYVDTYVPPEKWDIHSIMFGGIPNREVDELSVFWDALPGLRKDLFRPISSDYVEFIDEEIENFVICHKAAIKYKEKYSKAFEGFRDQLKDVLIGSYKTVSPQAEEERICAEIFERLQGIVAIDRYEAFQVLDDKWTEISVDLEILQTEGDAALTTVDPNYVTKQKDGKDIEVQDGWVGRILPFELVQELVLPEELESVREKERELASISSVYDEIIDSLSEEEKEMNILNDGNTAFVNKEVKAKVDEILDEIESDEINALMDYLTLSKRNDKINFVKNHSEVKWQCLTASANGTYTKAVINARVRELKRQHAFPEDSFEAKMLRVIETIDRESRIKKEYKELAADLHEQTKQTIEGMKKEDALMILERKWIDPIVNGLLSLPDNLLSLVIADLQRLYEKYKITFAEVGDKISLTERSVSGYVERLTGNEFDVEGLTELRLLLGGANDV